MFSVYYDNLYYPSQYVINGLTLSEPDNVWRFRNYFRTKANEVYYEQSPETQQRIAKIGVRIRKIATRLNTGKRERSPLGKETIRRHLIGGAVSFADRLDGGHTAKNSPPKRPAQPKKRSRKRKVVR